ncbi:TonB-dependent receptor domain-containing protein [Chitinophaga sp. XS-30]|uniref:TonB-dependent receptor domain-containing protein n=1 Tax=Chitinophaga sp. XS-30 TaxID=2604421 RepID=UPI0011DD47AB|nr:TonB-dependent receptor [Chitinophaga sp. XS-30]QEH43831.1 TonB-dependent receptor plug domain-containing protein [Chitinophaga sp. XS-30]
MSLARKLLLGLLFTWVPMQLFAWNWRTKITLSVKDQPLSVVCDLLEKEYGIHFSYSRDVVSMNRRVTLNVHQEPLRRVMEQLFSGQSVQFKRIGEQLVLAVKHTPGRTINGFVEDARTGEKLIGATIYAPHLQTGTVTNQYGFYSLTTEKDTLGLMISYVGYEPQRLSLKDKESRQISIRLAPVNTLEEVEVTENLPGLQEQTQMSKVNVALSQVKTMPRLLGESDVLRSIQAMPGVSGGMEGSSGIHVRGGSPDQNLILLDGTPVYNASHLFGVFSVFNPDIIKNVDLYKGAFPARYGGRLSSVVDISMKDGNMHSFHGQVSLGLLASNAMIEGPLIKGKTSFIVTARRTYADLLAGDLARDQMNLGEKGSFYAYFYDANIRINHIFSPRDRIFLSAYGGQDQASINRNMQFDSLNNEPKRYKELMDFEMGWGNQAYALRWNHIFSPRLFSNITFNYSRFLFRTEYNYDYEALDIAEKDNMYGRYYSSVENGGMKMDLDYRPNPEHSMRFGGQATFHGFRPGITSFRNATDNQQLTDTAYNDDFNKGAELSLYLEDDWQIGDSMYLNLGVHTAAFLVPGNAYVSIQPRLGFRYLLPRKWALKLSYTQMTQHIHLLANNATFLPTDLWVPATSKVKPMFSRQVAAGLAKTSADNRYEASVEVYYKSMRNVIEYVENNLNFQSASGSWDENVIVGRGRSYGMELLLQKKTGTFKGWIGYTLAKSERAFPNVNHGRVFPYKYDHRHEIEVVLSQQLGKRWELSANWQFNTGMPLTLPTGSYEQVTEPTPGFPPPATPPGEVDVVEKRNFLRMQDMHRLDISATHTKQRKNTAYILTFGFMNVYNRQNPFFYYYSRNEQTRERQLTMLSILPILPSISYAIKF